MADNRDIVLRKGDYVYGSFVKPEAIDGFINAVNPGDRADSLGRHPFSESSVDEAVDYANIGARAWRRASTGDRATAVRKFRDALHRVQDRMSRLITRETGKPLWEARQEVLATLRALDIYLEEGIATLAPRVIEDQGARSDRLPRGVIAVVSPYTFPALLPATQTAAALLAGNTVVLKPSKYTPGVGQLLAEMWDQCKLPRGVFNMVQGPGAVVGQRLVAHAGIDGVVFSGGYSTAQSIRQATGHRPELAMLLQCGGKAMALVLEDAELERAVYEIVIGAFLSSGQRHNSTARVFVVDSIFDNFVTELVKRTKRLVVGFGLEDNVFMGPLVSEALRNRYRRYARALTAGGHHALMDISTEGPAGRRGFYARPAIFRVQWENGASFLDEEPPGPLLLVYRVSNWEEAASLHNQAAFRLATSVFTKVDNPALGELKERLRTGALNVNRGTIGASLRLPSAGVGRSSNGVSSGLELLSALTTPRAQLIETRPLTDLVPLPGSGYGGAEAPAPRADIAVE